jgi:PAS domain S-box-containing protein
MVDPTTGTDASDLIESATPQATRRLLRDLRAQMIELEMQNEELRHSQAERDASQANFFDFYDMAPIGYCTVGENGLILQANLATAALIGVARVQLIQQPITRFIFSDDQDIYYLMQERTLGCNGPRFCELRMLKVDGSVFWARLDASIMPQSGTGSLRFVITNITDTKLAESERLAAHRELAIEAQQKSQRAAELLVANQELAFEAQEKGQRAAELLVANQELAFEAQEKGKRAGELLAAGCQ